MATFILCLRSALTFARLTVDGSLEKTSLIAFLTDFLVGLDRVLILCVLKKEPDRCLAQKTLRKPNVQAQAEV